MVTWPDGWAVMVVFEKLGIRKKRKYRIEFSISKLFLDSVAFILPGDLRGRPHIDDDLDTYRFVPYSH